MKGLLNFLHSSHLDRCLNVKNDTVAKYNVISRTVLEHTDSFVCMVTYSQVAGFWTGVGWRPMQQNWKSSSQSEKRLLALVYACVKFHYIIYGWAGAAGTDQQPLITILRKPLHTSSAEIQRMTFHLQCYNLKLLVFLFFVFKFCFSFFFLSEWREIGMWSRMLFVLMHYSLISCLLSFFLFAVCHYLF